MKKIFLLLICLLTLKGWAAQPFAYSDPELRQAAHAILKCPETKKLLEKVQKEGNINLRWSSFGGGGRAMWYGGHYRTIVLNSDNRSSLGERISSIVFEMHNALNNERFLKLDRQASQRRISKYDYVEKVERIEHDNALQASALLDRAIRKGYFPRDAEWPVYRNFDDHYRLQQSAGHSAQIAHIFDRLNPAIAAR